MEYRSYIGILSMIGTLIQKLVMALKKKKKKKRERESVCVCVCVGDQCIICKKARLKRRERRISEHII